MHNYSVIKRTCQYFFDILEYLMELSSRIKEYRKIFEWTQDDLAKNSGISLSTIKKYEAGSVENFTYENLKKISSAFNVSPSEFLDEFLSVNVSVNQNKNVRQLSLSQQNLKLSQNTAENAGRSKNLPINNDNLKSSQIEQIENDSIYIRKLSSNVGAGESVDIDGIEICDTDILVPFSRMLFKIHPKNYYNLRCMRVDGYSMAPMLFPDSWVIAEISPEFNGDGLYIICYCGNFMVKLLQKSPNGILHIKSVNKDYDSYEIGPDDKTEVYIVGRVLRCVI